MSTQTAMEQGQLIVLGKAYKTFGLPDGVDSKGDTKYRKLTIRRMGINYEILFKATFSSAMDLILKSQAEIKEKLQGFMDAGVEAGKVKFGIEDGLNVINELFEQLPEFQNFAVDAVMTIADAQKFELTPEYVRENLGTADCFAIITAQAEAQGLMDSFRSISAGLGTPRS